MSDKRIEVEYNGKWVAIAGLVPLGFGRGYLERQRETPGPKLAMRLVDPDTGKVLDKANANHEVNIGAGVGFPWAADYVRAASRALRISVTIASREERGRHVSPDRRQQLRAAVAELREVVGILEQLVAEAAGEP